MWVSVSNAIAMTSVGCRQTTSLWLRPVVSRAKSVASHVWVALGSNRDPYQEFPQAIQMLADRFGSISVSTVYRSPAEGLAGPDFLNCAAGFCTSLSVDELIRELKAIETFCGRQRGDVVAGPLGLDIDLLLYDDVIQDPPQRELPHPDILTKPYVLAPLAEIAGQREHPRLREELSKLWARMRPSVMNLQSLDWVPTSPHCDRHPPA